MHSPNQKQITVRIADGVHFVDCTLFGNYSISNNTVIQTKNASTITIYRKNHIVKLVDYFSKIDDTRISKLKIIAKKIAEVTPGKQTIGEPQEIHQFMVNIAKKASNEVATAKKAREKLCVTWDSWTATESQYELAMSNQKTLRKNRSYNIRGFDLVSIKNSTIPQIRLKEKEYKISQLHNEELTRQLPYEYYCWDHQTHEPQPELEFVDVIGVIENIEEKATYSVDTKSVIRVVLKNKFKSIRINFWADQMKNFENFNLKRKEGIIIEDIRKKQGKYYDFSLESTLIHLSEFPFLQQKFAHFLPEVTQTAPPQNIRELDLLYSQDPQNGKLHTLRAYLVGFKDKKVVYRLCDDCKKKVEKEAAQCQECASQNLVFKYNCVAEFSDSTGSLVVIFFDVTGQKLIGKSANEVSCMVEEETERLFESLFYKFYSISVQNRNQLKKYLTARPSRVIDPNEVKLIENHSRGFQIDVTVMQNNF